MALCPELTQHSQSPWVSLDGENNHADPVARDWVELCKVAPKRQYVPIALFYQVKTEVKMETAKFGNTNGSGGVYKNNGAQVYHGGIAGSGPRNGGYKGHSKKFSLHNKQNNS